MKFVAIARIDYCIDNCYQFLPARRYASAGTSHGPVSVRLCVCLSVCLSQVGVLSKRMNESSWFFGTGASFDPRFTVLKGNSDISKNNYTSLWNVLQNSEIKKILLRYIDRRNVLST